MSEALLVRLAWRRHRPAATAAVAGRAASVWLALRWLTTEAA